MTMKTKRIVRARFGADGKLRRVSSSGRTGRVIEARVNAERLDDPAAFVPDDDTPILTRRELRELQPPASGDGPDIAALRRRLRMSQGAFALVFGIPLPTVKDWEQGRRKPDAPARAYLHVISRNPSAVRDALKTVTGA
jgi:DNA-binding transcriptional regulator YiaG